MTVFAHAVNARCHISQCSYLHTQGAHDHFFAHSSLSIAVYIYCGITSYKYLTTRAGVVKSRSEKITVWMVKRIAYLKLTCMDWCYSHWKQGQLFAFDFFPRNSLLFTFGIDIFRNPSLLQVVEHSPRLQSVGGSNPT